MRFGIREFALLALVLAIPLAAWFFVFRPQNAEIASAVQEIGLKRETLRKLEQETSRNEDLERANAQIASSIEEIEARLPTNKELDHIVRQISDLAVESGLDVPALKSGKPIEAATYWEQPIEVQSGGDFRGYYEFLQRLERLPRITRISDFHLRRSARDDGKVTISFTLSIFFQEERK